MEFIDKKTITVFHFPWYKMLDSSSDPLVSRSQKSLNETAVVQDQKHRDNSFPVNHELKNK